VARRRSATKIGQLNDF
jgi:hypothetical protein